MSLSCGCTPDASGFGWCSECVAALRKKIWNEMSAEDRNYDRHFAPGVSAGYDKACDIDPSEDQEPDHEGCSCHINTPCSFCTSQGEEDDE